MSEHIVKVENIHKSFSGVKALTDVDLAIRPGEIKCLAGENGSGKSTLIKIISGVYSYDSGNVFYNDKPIKHISPIIATMNGIQVIYQDLSVFPNLTVMENLAINLEVSEKRKFINWRKYKLNAKAAIDRISIDVDLHKKVEDLSIADKQLIAICRALICDAKLIIMDEPTTALTKKEVRSLFRKVKELQAQGIAILFVSHKLDEVFEISETYSILRNGRLVASGIAQDLDNEKFTFHMTGRKINRAQATAKDISEDPVLEIKNLHLAPYYEDVSFCLRKGEILGITGLLGSGRTELALSISGMMKPKSGEIYINGKQVKINNIFDAKKLKIGYVPEDRLSEGLFLQQSIKRNIVIGSLDKVSNPIGIIDNSKVESKVKDWLQKLSIATNDPDNAASSLSGGNQQRVVLAKCLANKLDVLLLNGPTVGVDIGSKFDIHSLLRMLAEQGLAIIIISDDIQEIIDNCNRIIIMKKGRIVSEIGSTDLTEKDLLEKIW